MTVLIAETHIEAIYADHLRREGWEVTATKGDHADIRATRGDQRLVAEVKGHTSSEGTTLDIGYGQLLRRMDLESGPCRYVLVVPSIAQLALRVRRSVRARLGIELVQVTPDGEVEPLA